MIFSQKSDFNLGLNPWTKQEIWWMWELLIVISKSAPNPISKSLNQTNLLWKILSLIIIAKFDSSAGYQLYLFQTQHTDLTWCQIWDWIKVKLNHRESKTLLQFGVRKEKETKSQKIIRNHTQIFHKILAHSKCWELNPIRSGSNLLRLN